MPAKYSEKTHGEKLLSLYVVLMVQNGRYLSLHDMAEMLNCSKPTVLRLLSEMEASGFGKLEEPVSQGKEHYYRMMPEVMIPVNLGANELAQLALCRKMLLHLLPDKAFSLQKQGEETKAQTTAQVIYKGYIDYNRYQDQYTTLLQAIQRRRVCEITYKKSIFKEPRSFSFAPMRIISYRETLAVVGWEVTDKGKVCQIYDNWLWLYVQRIQKVLLSRRKSDNLPEIQEYKSAEGNFGIMTGDAFEVGLLFNMYSADYVSDRIWSNDQKIEIVNGDSLKLSMTVSNLPEVVSWILSFGKNVTVLYPEWLKLEIDGEAREIAEKYSADSKG